jgi:hypothetical protein
MLASVYPDAIGPDSSPLAARVTSENNWRAGRRHVLAVQIVRKEGWFLEAPLS